MKQLLREIFTGVTEGSELRRRSDSALGINVDLEADRQFVVRQKGVDANGDTVYKKQSISLVEALISDLALGAEFLDTETCKMVRAYL